MLKILRALLGGPKARTKKLPNFYPSGRLRGRRLDRLLLVLCRFIIPMLLRSLFFFVVASFGLELSASIRGCDPQYLRQAYSEAHQFAAIEGAPYALLANNAYATAGTRFQLPAGWQSLKQGNEHRQIGLQYELFGWQESGQTQRLTLAFRGTDELIDWWHGAITGTQYQQALAITAGIRKQYPGLPLVVTGHSLGGGLALHVSMLMEQVSAYAFNPSPITRNPAKPMKNRRVVYWEYDDPLHYGRRLLMQVPDAVFWKFDFVKRDGHKSEVLAKGLLMLAALNNDEYAQTLVRNCDIDPLSR